MDKSIIPEIRAILNKMGVRKVEELSKIVNIKFTKVCSMLPHNTKYRDSKKLLALVIYFTLKSKNVPVTKCDFMENLEITRMDFFQLKYTLIKHFPECEEINRKSYILQLIFNISDYFQWGSKFCYFSKVLLNGLWRKIQSAKDEVIAGLIITLIVKTCLEKRGSTEFYM